MLSLYISPSKPVPHALVDGALRSAAEGAEADLVRALAGADADAYQILWRRFHPVVSAMVQRRLRNRGDTEDLVQEVFLALFKSAPALRDPLALRAFVFTITARMLNRKLKRRRTGLQLALASQGQMENLVGTTADSTAKHAVAGLRKLMGRLRAREREAFVLHFVGGLDATDVAQRLGVSTPTARRSLSRACRYVRLWASRDPFLFDYVQPRCQEPEQRSDDGAAHSQVVEAKTDSATAAPHGDFFGFLM
jgi:RNA polymerase sigma-70 factor (ECF subfamily)